MTSLMFWSENSTILNFNITIDNMKHTGNIFVMNFYIVNIYVKIFIIVCIVKLHYVKYIYNNLFFMDLYLIFR